jgi:hypothetical protein
LAEHGTRIDVQGNLKAIEKEADDDEKLIDERSSTIMIQIT